MFLVYKMYLFSIIGDSKFVIWIHAIAIAAVHNHCFPLKNHNNFLNNGKYLSLKNAS